MCEHGTLVQTSEPDFDESMNESAPVQSEPRPGFVWPAVRWLLRCGMWLLLLAYLFSFFGQRFFVAELLSNFRYQFLILFIFATILARPLKASWLLFTCMVFATAWSGWETGQLFLPVKQPEAGKTVFRVMSFNVLADNTEFETGVAEVRKHDPDVVAVLEYANMWHVAFDALNESHPYQHRDPRWHGYGIAIFSKFPLESAKAIPLTEKFIDNPAAVANVIVDDQVFRIMAVHVMSPINRKRLELRNQQFKEIASNVNAESIPTILVGDMNCSPASQYLSDLIDSANLRDSRRGFGIYGSWPGKPAPFSIPIDHVLVSSRIHVHNRFLGDAGGSDHQPVIVDVSISGDQDQE